MMKRAKQENFPVASLLLAADKRRVVMAYYAFARAADDIADDPRLQSPEKLRRLGRFEAALLCGECKVPEALDLRARLLERGLPLDLAARLLVAFRRDAACQEIENREDLLDYCRYSANPVGRFLLRLHGESETLQEASDALCSALQVLNHLQDCKSDWRALGRCYLPQLWLREAGVSEAELASVACGPALRRVLDRCLEETEELLARTGTLPSRIADRRLAFQAGVTLSLARRLQRRLRSGDPLAVRVRLTRGDFLRALPAGAGPLLAGRRPAP